jgi:hypothetical protein
MCAGTNTATVIDRFTEAESEDSVIVLQSGCAGGQNEAGATPGHLCIFQASTAGEHEAQWKNAKFVQVEEPDTVLATFPGIQGVRVVFRTTGFNATTTGTVPAGGATLSAGGPWALTAP